jgi:hypothetical protein
VYLFALSVQLAFVVFLLSPPVARGADFSCPGYSEQTASDIKGEINGKAQTLLKIGDAELQGTVKNQL